jgi:hypothetical protein
MIFSIDIRGKETFKNHTANGKAQIKTQITSEGVGKRIMSSSSTWKI